MAMATVKEISGGRWSYYIDKFIGDWEHVASEIENDYQGSCAIVGFYDEFPNPQYALAEWSYGSCSGCDGYEDMNEAERLSAFLRQIEFVDENTMLKMALNALDTTSDSFRWNDRRSMYEKVVNFIIKRREDDE
jgi:hypothetical protein